MDAGLRNWRGRGQTFSRRWLKLRGISEKLTAETLLLFGVEKLWDLIVRESERLKGVDEQFTELKKLGKASGIRKHMRRLAFSIVDCMEHATEIRGSSKRISKVILSMQSFGLQQSISGDGYSQPLQERREMQKTFSNDNENNLVGLEKNVKTLVHYLVEEDCIRVISITRMGGIGKTTIARQVFNHETVKNHFEGLAWVCVSQQFTRKDVWRTILRNLQPNYEEITEDEIQNKLFGLMETQNYLIVHDDIWKEEDWDRIKPFFFIKMGVSQTYGRTQTNLQVEVQPTDRPSLRVCK
ncbi:BnaC04g18730D [Brassica napus]|uniref:BnaC04g18730D protein n=1 Tax=Brassica napus TaxID=3708 RepID=A0A078GRM1_BRANA|nr:BnaC04g18730D [Brassica napus]